MSINTRIAGIVKFRHFMHITTKNICIQSHFTENWISEIKITSGQMNSNIVRRIEWFSIDIGMSNFSNFAVLLESFLVM